jgi:hypothetical protein
VWGVNLAEDEGEGAQREEQLFFLESNIVRENPKTIDFDYVCLLAADP